MNQSYEVLGLWIMSGITFTLGVYLFYLTLKYDRKLRELNEVLAKHRAIRERYINIINKINLEKFIEVKGE